MVQILAACLEEGNSDINFSQAYSQKIKRICSVRKKNSQDIF
jgi:hypothetical protein